MSTASWVEEEMVKIFTEKEISSIREKFRRGPYGATQTRHPMCLSSQQALLQEFIDYIREQRLNNPTYQY